ncbi:MAG: SprT-like domain-containing protein [Chthoniobacterales bacterium]
MKKKSLIQLLLFDGFWSDSKPRPDSRAPAWTASKITKTDKTAISSRGDRDLVSLVDDLLIKAGAPNLVGKLSVRWKPRLRTTLGIADYQKKTIFLNPVLHKISQQEIDRTLRHELAHFLAQHRVGMRKIAPHGKEWHKACADLGIPDESRCHHIPLEQRRMKPKFFYQCPNCKFILPRVRKMKGRAACIKCCRKYSKGRFDARFCFLLLPAQKIKSTNL